LPLGLRGLAGPRLQLVVTLGIYHATLGSHVAYSASETRERALEERVHYLERRLERLEARFGRPDLTRHGRTTAMAPVAAPPAPGLPQSRAPAPSEAANPPSHADANSRASLDTAPRPGTGKPSDAAQETFVFRENSVTLKPARIEASTQFAYVRANGFLQTDRAFASTSSLRVGVFDWMEIGVTVPFFSATRSRVVGPFASQEQAVRGLGDIGLQASLRVYEQTENTPGAVLSVGGVLPTGVSPYRFAFYQPNRDQRGYNPNPTNLNGNYLSRGVGGITGNLQIYKTLDPVIVFLGGGAQRFFDAQIKSHTVQPGMTYTYNLGLSLALSEKSTLGLQINGSYAGKLLVDKRRVPASELEPVVVRTSLVQRVFANTFIEPELTAGLTNNAPNLGLAMGLRHRF